jgi:hypothetical protein
MRANQDKMETPRHFNDLLRDPRVKAYFLRLIESPISAEEKYQKLLAFAAGLNLDAAAAPIPSEAAQQQTFADADLLDLLPRTAESIRLAVGRLQVSQHQDGGWGFRIGQSDLWGTAYALEFLHAARELPGLSAADVEPLLAGGVAFLEQHPELWAAESVASAAGLSVYDVGLMVRCFYHLGRSFMRRESSQRVYRSIGRLYRSQNEDGGWDANIWGYEIGMPTQVWSEAGATSSAIRALVQTQDTRFQPAVEKGLLWLAAAQNPDGSWNDGSCRPGSPAFQLSGLPALNKTCDAIQAILFAEALDLSLLSYRASLERAATWLLRRDQDRRCRQSQAAVSGLWFSRADYEQACLVLETLSYLPDQAAQIPLLPVQACAAAWLVSSQRRQEGDLEHGSWVMGHTARIGLALTRFYRIAQPENPSQQAPWLPG